MTLLVVGLGNPGSKYQGTRHNTGYDVVDKMASKLGIKFKKSFFRPFEICQTNYSNHKIILVKPTTYMNNSGTVLPILLDKFLLTVNNLLIVVDNLDIDEGFLKFKTKGSDGGHNGLKSINDCIGTQEYKRLFIGIGRPPKGHSIVDYVLSPITSSKVYSAEEKAVDGIFKILSEPLEQVQNFLNRKTSDQ